MVLVGHSIGGIIAKSVKDKLEENKVKVVVTLATPHQPVVLLDYQIRWVWIFNCENKVVFSEISILIYLDLIDILGYNDLLFI